jgi:glycyl-tRNA synthetase
MNISNELEKIVSLCRRKGFVFLSSEIYGGFGSCYDYGPLGVEMKNNIKKCWWEEMTRKKEKIVGLDAAILMSPKVWEASGHLTAGFADELVECKKCHHRFRKDFLQDSHRCPDCQGELTLPRKFNLMMKTFVGPVEDKASQTYLRAETCQGIYVNFKNIINSMRLKIPFGIAQIGKAFRNEITPGNFIFRTREFEQMEMQWFCNPKDADKFFEYFKKERIKWYLKLGINKQNLRIKEIPEKERAHYAIRQIDIEYRFPFGWKEIEGVHNRGDWDLKNHSKYSNEDLSYFDEKTKNSYYPYIIETSVGVERAMLAFLCEAYQEIEGGRNKNNQSTKEKEIVLKLSKKLSPIKVAVFPLLKNKKELVKKAKEVFKMVKPHFYSFYDETDSIGRRYRRQDEVGTPFCITIDFDSIKKNDVTVRDRNTMKQKRIKIKYLVSFLKEKLEE